MPKVPKGKALKVLGDHLVDDDAEAVELKIKGMFPFLWEDSVLLLKGHIILPLKIEEAQGQGCSLDHPKWWVLLMVIYGYISPYTEKL